MSCSRAEAIQQRLNRLRGVRQSFQQAQSENEPTPPIIQPIQQEKPALDSLPQFPTLQPLREQVLQSDGDWIDPSEKPNSIQQRKRTLRISVDRKIQLIKVSKQERINKLLKLSRKNNKRPQQKLETVKGAEQHKRRMLLRQSRTEEVEQPDQLAKSAAQQRAAGGGGGKANALADKVIRDVFSGKEQILRVILG